MTSELLPHLQHPNMGYTEFDYTHLYLGMVSFIHLLVMFLMFIRLIASEPISDDVIRKLVMNAIREHNLALMVGKHCHCHSNVEDIVQTYRRGCILSMTTRELR
jgi:hypothetical protein